MDEKQENSKRKMSFMKCNDDIIDGGTAFIATLQCDFEYFIK